MTVLGVDRLSDRVRRRATWAAPVVVVAAVGIGVAIANAGPSNATPALPARSAAQLLTTVQSHTTTALSGVVRETANLGLPSLPGDQSSASLSWQSFITGSHDARVWVDGATRQRVALLGELSEADVVHNGTNLWTYTSDTNTVTHTVLKHATDQPSTPSASDYTPAAVTARVLKAIKPSTSVTVDPAQTVAGRPAYTLVVRPKDSRSTVREVTVAIDAAKHVPLQVQVFGAGSTPAFQFGFSKISFATPAASTFQFATPAGAHTTTNPLLGHDRGMHRHVRPAGPAGKIPSNVPGKIPGSARAGGSPKVIGSGWTAVAELPNGISAIGGQAGSTLQELTTKVGTSGERLLHTALVNAVILPDGRTFVGAVEPALLEHIAATTPR